MQALAFIDLLGFSQMVGGNLVISKSILNDFYNLTYNIIKDNDSIDGHLFSDSLLAYSDEPADLVNVITEIYRKCLRKNDLYSYDLSKYFLLPRGGISFGIVDIQKRIPAPNLSKNFIVSPALVHSAKMESKIKGSRLLIADSKNNKDQIFNWNENVKGILSENSTFTFWANFKYYDSLWFLDLKKSYDEQKDEVIKLIDIAIKLAKSNSQNKKVIEQHLQTLRIGLLSYTKFLKPKSDPILSRILTEFEDDKYWLIWITVFEMVMQSSDNWAFPTKPEIINFYKKISLRNTWADVIKFINKPHNDYLANLINNFIQELAIVQKNKIK